MRECFGDGRVAQLADGSFGIEALGLASPAVLIQSIAGDPAPDLSAHVGKAISYVGLLEAAEKNITAPRLHCVELQLQEQEPLISPMWAVVSGNLGNAPEANPKGDRITASVALTDAGDQSSWLRLTCYSYYAIADIFAGFEKGTPLIAYGAIESYTYNSKPHLQLAVRGLQRLPRSGGEAPKPPTVLFSSRTEADVAAHAFDDAA